MGTWFRARKAILAGLLTITGVQVGVLIFIGTTQSKQPAVQTYRVSVKELRKVQCQVDSLFALANRREWNELRSAGRTTRVLQNLAALDTAAAWGHRVNRSQFLRGRDAVERADAFVRGERRPAEFLPILLSFCSTGAAMDRRREWFLSQTQEERKHHATRMSLGHASALIGGLGPGGFQAE